LGWSDAPLQLVRFRWSADRFVVGNERALQDVRVLIRASALPWICRGREEAHFGPGGRTVTAAQLECAARSVELNFVRLRIFAPTTRCGCAVNDPPRLPRIVSPACNNLFLCAFNL